MWANETPCCSGGCPECDSCANRFDSACCHSALFPHQGLKRCVLPVGDKWCLKATRIKHYQKKMAYILNYPVSHPAICGFRCMFVVWLWGQHSLVLPRGAQGLPRPDRIIPPASFGSSPVSPLSGMCLEIFQQQEPTKHPNQMTEPHQLTPFKKKEQWLFSKHLPDNGAAPLLSEAQPSPPVREAHLKGLYSGCCSFGHIL